MGTSLFAFVIVLGVLIFFHELGHFLVARYFGVGVEKFSLGFGPRLIGKKIGITEYLLSAVPLGGYVKMMGEDFDEDVDPADEQLSFAHKHVVKRILIVAAGPCFNLLLAMLIFFFIFMISGLYIIKPSVGKIQEGKPAQAAGIQANDLIVAIDGTSISSWDEMSEIISGSQGKPIELTVRRDGVQLPIRLQPELTVSKNLFGEEVPRYIIGISASGDAFVKELNLFQALGESVVQTYTIARLTVVSIVKLIEGTISSKTLGGPIMIAEMAGQQARAGAGNLVFFIALLSINLAILNFLPIPVLDGGHLLFFFIELLIGRPVNLRMREIAQQVGIFILILLMAFVFYNDITRIFFS